MILLTLEELCLAPRRHPTWGRETVNFLQTYLPDWVECPARRRAVAWSPLRF